MAMAMNIKSPEAHELAKKVADLTGETLTEAVIVSLRERFERLVPEQRDADGEREARVMELIARMQVLAAGEPSLQEINESLYDPETGLPA